MHGDGITYGIFTDEKSGNTPYPNPWICLWIFVKIIIGNHLKKTNVDVSVSVPVVFHVVFDLIFIDFLMFCVLLCPQLLSYDPPSFVLPTAVVLWSSQFCFAHSFCLFDVPSFVLPTAFCLFDVLRFCFAHSFCLMIFTVCFTHSCCLLMFKYVHIFLSYQHSYVLFSVDGSTHLHFLSICHSIPILLQWHLYILSLIRIDKLITNLLCGFI